MKKASFFKSIRDIRGGGWKPDQVIDALTRIQQDLKNRSVVISDAEFLDIAADVSGYKRDTLANYIKGEEFKKLMNGLLSPSDYEFLVAHNENCIQELRRIFDILKNSGLDDDAVFKKLSDIIRQQYRVGALQKLKNQLKRDLSTSGKIQPAESALVRLIEERISEFNFAETIIRLSGNKTPFPDNFVIRPQCDFYFTDDKGGTVGIEIKRIKRRLDLRRTWLEARYSAELYSAFWLIAFGNRKLVEDLAKQTRLQGPDNLRVIFVSSVQKKGELVWQYID